LPDAESIQAAQSSDILAQLAGAGRLHEVGISSSTSKRSFTMQQAVSRRTVVAGMLASAAMLCLKAPGIRAQEATPAATSAPSMFTGYPQLDVTITDSAAEVSMDQVPAGNIILNVINKTSSENSAGIIGPGEGETMDDLKTAAATPGPQDEFPPFFYTSAILGGPGTVPPGESKQVLVTVPAGDWVIFTEGNLPPTFFSAVESADSNTTNPTAAASVALGDFYFGGLDKVAAGPQIWQVTNEGVQPHMLVMGKVPDGTTFDQIMATIQTEMTGTPAAGALGPDQVQFLNDGVLLLSKGKTMWLPLDVADGTYVVMCFVTDPSTGKPHVMEGMVNMFTTGGAATPTS